MDKLPQELIDKIISSIDRTKPDGRSALCACSRVCRSWRRQAQKELLLDIKLSVEQLDKWHSNIPLDSEVSSYVRRLRWAIRPARRRDPFLEDYFPGRFATFSNLEILQLSSLSLRHLRTTAIERIFDPLAYSLRHLCVAHLITDREKWCFLVSRLPNLRCLDIFSATMLEKGKPGPNLPLSFNFTGHMGAYRDNTEEFFRCISGLKPRFESLGVPMLTGGLVDTLNLVLKSCSATLTTITITPLEPSKKRDIRRAMPRLDLSSCNNLRTLRVHPEFACLPEFDALLQTISSKHFNKLVLGPYISDILPHWNTNDRALHSFAERLYRLGATKPVKMMLELRPVGKGRVEIPNLKLMWPLFCEEGVIVKGYSRGSC